MILTRLIAVRTTIPSAIPIPLAFIDEGYATTAPIKSTSGPTAVLSATMSTANVPEEEQNRPDELEAVAGPLGGPSRYVVNKSVAEKAVVDS